VNLIPCQSSRGRKGVSAPHIFKIKAFMGHSERAVVFCAKRYEVLDDDGRLVVAADGQSPQSGSPPAARQSPQRPLTIRVQETWGAPAAIFEIRRYA
jgi:hypothetical protein